jgi:glycosyltransferase involved in cell wall biosynthesis
LDQPEILNATSPAPAPKPLRILIVLNLEWNPRLGAVRVYMELAEQWRAAGNVVEHFSLSDAFPRVRSSRAGFAIRQIAFAYKAAAFVKENAARFDVIDALIGSLPMSKKKLGFVGLLVARSVGLYRLYDRFEMRARQRWPHRSRGKFLGRIFYSLTRRWLTRASDQAVRHADLINVPNENEAVCLRRELGSADRIIVQPYGLTNDRCRALLEHAAPATVRLAGKKISFIGMWAARKGSHDWAQIIRRVRQNIPDARFCFLGTMVEAGTISSDLGNSSRRDVEFISEYSPEDLPKLLSDCAAGAFPSYVEGFGLAVLEQLAAGIPTVAFDVPGPGDILGEQLPELLVVSGEIDAFAAAICHLLKLDVAAYESLSKRCVGIAATFNWRTIAGNALAKYRERLREQQKILFLQPFSLGSAGGGGARILRALLKAAPVNWHSVCCSPRRPKPWPNETHLPSRPSWGKIETSRLSMLPKKTMSIFAPRFRRRLKSFSRRMNVRAIHTVPHSGIDFAQGQAVARELSLPFFISLHDDLAYTAAAEVSAAAREPAIREAWLNADARFVISDALGREYSRRYGSRDYCVVTDGLAEVHPYRKKPEPLVWRIYFMGLFHLAYERNFRAFLEALNILERQTSTTTSVTCRCEYIRPHVWKDIKQVNVLPFAGEEQVQCDMQKADLLYMPMPFGPEHENFARFSVSTKMVTYVGSGIPIVYHGPTDSAAFDLLQRNNAAIFLPTLDPAEVAESLAQLTDGRCAEVATNAGELARREFMLADQTHRFWDTISQFIEAQ